MYCTLVVHCPRKFPGKLSAQSQECPSQDHVSRNSLIQSWPGSRQWLFLCDLKSTDIISVLIDTSLGFILPRYFELSIVTDNRMCSGIAANTFWKKRGAM